MWPRHKPRFSTDLPVSIWGTDTSGRAFHQLACTLDISTDGARLAGVLASLACGDIISVRYKQRKARFQVVWTDNSQVGIQFVDGEKLLWIESPEEEILDGAVVREAASFSGDDPGVLQDYDWPGPPAERDSVALLAGLNDEIRSTPASAEETLVLIAERARSFTDADGAALALRDEDDMVCCASAGLAPLVGVRFSVAGGLAGEAIATRWPVLCLDVEKDQRVDAALCRSLHLGSSAIVPIVARDTVMGVLQVFAARPHAFDEASTSLLQHLADFVVSLAPDLRLEPNPR
jgi:putative methionine-R-sulfoxide reductase with GAF domain